jgi:UDP-3-O-[3-hydroxymyristoyl] N-acetylglucosamine deacetylase
LPTQSVVSEIQKMSFASLSRKQRTLGGPCSFSGSGIFTGRQVAVSLKPAPENHGIVFVRIDLPEKTEIPAHFECVQSTQRCTVLAKGAPSVHTVEHLLAALKAFDIDNAIVEISGPEVPILDGSSLPFVQLIEEVGVVEQGAMRSVVRLKEAIYWSDGSIHLVALPSDTYRISYTLHYPHSRFLGSQYYSSEITQDIFKRELAPCRTFCLYEEIAPMIEKGLLKGGDLQNGVIIKDDQVLNPEGLRFSDEMVRHKVLDVVGDLSLIPIPFLAHIIAIRAGHTSNNAFARVLFNKLESYQN